MNLLPQVVTVHRQVVHLVQVHGVTVDLVEVAVVPHHYRIL
tara:strand:- start:334 stop:456 length:123 start_codon:yes stop_codon:yes gene_type:complete